MEHISNTIKNMGNNKEITRKLLNNPNVSDDVVDNCEICHGAHIIHPIIKGEIDYSHTIPCSCQKDINNKKRREYLFKFCALPPKSEEYTFQNFNNYSEVRMALLEAKKIASSPNESFWIVLLGKNGVGKTHLGIAICNELLNQGIITKYIYVPLLLDELREGYRHQDDDSYDERFRRYRTIPVLFLDDLGKIFPDEYERNITSAWAREKIETLLDYRYMNKLSLIVTSNKSLDELPEGIASRLARPSYQNIIVIDTIDYALREKADK